MATQTLKVLGQLNPAATTLTTLYTVPVATTAAISSIIVCNQNNADATFRVSIAVNGAADNAKQYIAYDITVPANDLVALTIGASLGAGDVIRAYASTTTLSFSAFGAENA